MEKAKINEAIRPLLIMLRCFGFDLNEQNSSKTFKRLFSTLCLSLYIAASVVNILTKMKPVILKSEWNIEKISLLIDILNYNIINTIFMNITLYVLSWNGITDLWKALGQLEESQHFDYKFYSNIQRQSWVAVFYSTVYVTVF